LRAKADDLLRGRRPFHWPLECPEVFVKTEEPAIYDGILPPRRAGGGHRAAAGPDGAKLTFSECLATTTQIVSGGATWMLCSPPISLLRPGPERVSIVVYPRQKIPPVSHPAPSVYTLRID
jgi:hypothetical protein